MWGVGGGRHLSSAEIKVKNFFPCRINLCFKHRLHVGRVSSSPGKQTEVAKVISFVKWWERRDGSVSIRSPDKGNFHENLESFFP